MLRLTRYSPFKPSNDTVHLALTQWIRAAAQRNIDALVKVGDYYYHGLGVPQEEEPLRYEKAARYYRSASDTQMSALAMWNLGWMYENGVGVPQVMCLNVLGNWRWPINISLLGFPPRQTVLRPSSGDKFGSVSACNIFPSEIVCKKHLAYNDGRQRWADHMGS